MELKCAVQKYEWGKIGRHSMVAVLCENGDEDFILDETAPYAELWMGTHPNGPSCLKGQNTMLSSLISDEPDCLGVTCIDTFGPSLPFLFKVLSVNKALSIQAHPNKKHAEELHMKCPDLYKDPNHKPELAIALTPFEALCGFRPVEEIKEFIKGSPELQRLIGDAIFKKYVIEEQPEHEVIRQCFISFMSSCPGDVTLELQNLLDRLLSLGKEAFEKQLGPLVKRLYTQYPNDVGCFSIYFLNVVNLKPSQALYLGPNEPHAYLSGDCIECMACSDNVVRAGLTPKFKDVRTLCEMLIYKGEKAESKLFKPLVENEYSQIFKPPVPDFSVARIEIPANIAYKLIPRPTASIFLVVEGSGKFSEIDLKKGSVIFLRANETHVITSHHNRTLIFQAMANV